MKIALKDRLVVLDSRRFHARIRLVALRNFFVIFLFSNGHYFWAHVDLRLRKKVWIVWIGYSKVILWPIDDWRCQYFVRFCGARFELAYISKIWNLKMSKLWLFSNFHRFDVSKNGLDCLNWMFQSHFMANRRFLQKCWGQQIYWIRRWPWKYYRFSNRGDSCNFLKTSDRHEFGNHVNFKATHQIARFLLVAKSECRIFVSSKKREPDFC